VAAPARDYYAVLGVPRDADAKGIKDAFRRLARRYHPDASTESDAAERFKEIAEAYGVLSDPARRAAYDAGGLSGQDRAMPGDLWAGIDFGDIFGAAGDSAAAALFERLFGAAVPSSRGDDLTVALAIPLQRVLTGGKQDITITRPGPCRQCAGTGADQGTALRRCRSCAGTGRRAVAGHRGSMVVQQLGRCPACDGRGAVIVARCPGCRGSGRADVRETITIRIPPGIPEETVMRLPGYGLPSPALDGLPGDAYVIVRSRPDPRCRRAGADLRLDLHISVADAALGTTAQVPALDGEVKVAVAAGTQPGTMLRIPGKGLPRYRKHGHGDLEVTVFVDIPPRASRRQRELYEQLREADAATGQAAARAPANGAAGPAAPGDGAAAPPATGAAGAGRRRRPRRWFRRRRH